MSRRAKHRVIADSISGLVEARLNPRYSDWAQWQDSGPASHAFDTEIAVYGTCDAQPSRAVLAKIYERARARAGRRECDGWSTGMPQPSPTFETLNQAFEAIAQQQVSSSQQNIGEGLG